VYVSAASEPRRRQMRNIRMEDRHPRRLALSVEAGPIHILAFRNPLRGANVPPIIRVRRQMRCLSGGIDDGVWRVELVRVGGVRVQMSQASGAYACIAVH
jgi:hypothetical protein